MKKIIIGLLMIIALGVMYFTINEEVPQAKEPVSTTDSLSAADELADKMLKAINKTAWDNIRFVQWSFRDKRHFVWDKQEHMIQVQWKDYRALIDPNSSTGVVFENGSIVNAEQLEKLVKDAIDAFNNDSFWLNAPAKAYDHGTERSIVEHEGKDALMVKYTTGGTTPGDSYLWILDDNGLPTAYKIWVSIIPVGGMEFSWEDWQEFDDAMLSQMHKSDATDLAITNIKTGNTLADLNLEEDIFAALKD